MAARLSILPGLRRRVALLALTLGVLIVHGCVTRGLADRLIDLDKDQAMPARMEVVYVRDMALAAPKPTAAPAAPPPPAAAPVRRAAPPVKQASAPEIAAAPVLAVASPPESMPEPESEPAAAVEQLAEVPPAAPVEPASAPASAPASFEWPASTRMSYALTGNFRGEVSGSAQVEWIRAGSRYQVHLDLVVGPSIAPIITRRMSSDGEITAAGLSPQRYDQDTKVVMRDRHRATIAFAPDSVLLANGERRDTVPGIQDTASQFVQLTYVFSTRPELLRVGGTVDIPLALPHKIDVWTYDVVEEEVLHTNFGPLPSIHLKPRRVSPRVGELSAEIWFAPQLRYLPVRIRINQDANNYLDLLIAKKPEMGAP
ncbi:MAG: DUF3108 domain-containing protein [Burkholderiales bacterium]